MWRNGTNKHRKRWFNLIMFNFFCNFFVLPVNNFTSLSFYISFNDQIYIFINIICIRLQIIILYSCVMY